MVDELLVATVASVGFSAAAFYAIGFQGSFGLFWLIYLLVLYIGIVLAYWIAAISPNMDVANALLPIYVTTQLLFGGFILDYHAIPVWWKWFSYLDFMRVRARAVASRAAQRADAPSLLLGAVRVGRADGEPVLRPQGRPHLHQRQDGAGAGASAPRARASQPGGSA